MTRVLAHRLLDLTVVLWGVSALVFLMIRFIPGDAVQIMLGANVEITPERLQALYRKIGLDKSLLEQYASWIGGVLVGDFGTSLWTGAPVGGEIVARLGVTCELLLLSLGTAVALAVPAGCLMAYVRRSTSDYVVRIVTIVGVTIPSFWLGIVLILTAYKLFPGFASIGYVPFTDDPLANLSRMILPTVSLALPILASLSRIMRSAMLDALGQDYVRTARAKGVSETAVIFRHALRNALIPFVTAVGITAGYLFGGAIVVEQVFALPGLGRLVIGAIAERNYPLIQATILLVTSGFVVVNFLVDMLYVAIDPRVREA
ncbi:MAG: ABC transporter permease [Alphaproteobacteria bacterium]|nr:ABC transporter permease [Alphaproteobacteria bacterium]